MLASQIPTKFPIPFGNNAAAGTIRTVPQASQTATSPGQASLYDGFPVATGQPLASGGVPPAMQDFNGLFNQISAWSRWQAAAGLAPYDATFSTAIGGYPAGATILSATTPGRVWISTAENNTTNPDSGSAANWLLLMLKSDVLPYTTAGATETTAFQAGIVLTDMPNQGQEYIASQTAAFSGASYTRVKTRCSIANPQSGNCNLYAKGRLIRVSDSAIIGTGQFLGGVCANGTAIPMTTDDTFRSLDPAQSYRAQLITSKNSNVGPVMVNDTWVSAEHN